ncbi:MAG: hydantoinase/oxoprolinase family protein [Methanomethylovorans sp.]|uniref:hydantoinase/oxoprolinase family protein n=1 Tax=Methanomethylovorans sp. TaxID=2758717 RepID=UPI0035305821
MRFLGIDIGGANTKIATSDRAIVELHYLPLWKDTTLPQTLKDIAKRLNPDMVAVVITGELADCFEDKMHGLKFIMQAVENAFGCEVRYIGTNGEVHEHGEELRNLAAANWAASSRLIGEEIGDCIFVDVGSTTTDIIPIVDAKHVASTTDFKRLLASELVYMGTLRTNVATLLDKVELEQGTCRVSSELFTTTGDVYLLLEDIRPETYTCTTADGAGKSRIEAMRRLARLVCADLEEISEDDVMDIAKQVREKQISLLTEAITTVSQKYGTSRIVAAGIGEFMIIEAAERLGMEYISVAEKWGKEISDVFPAYAAAWLIEKAENRQ